MLSKRLMSQTPSVADVEAIGDCPSHVLRNLRITQAYHELTTAAASVLGPGANWCTFATWASKQAGQTIRGEDLGRKIEDAFATSRAVHVVTAGIRDLQRAAGQTIEATTVLRAIRDACAPLLSVGRVADAVARGNKKVFDEIGAEFARFVTVLPRQDGDEAAVDAFCRRFRPGDPPAGQRLLAAAFRDYDRARRLTDPKARAERMFLANVRIGMHEQTRLQPEIADALNAPVPDAAEIGRRLVETLFTGQPGPVPGSRHVLAEISGRLVEPLRAVVRRVVTDELMTLTLPGRTLHLGVDLAGSFPLNLTKLADPEVVAFVGTIDPTTDSPVGSGAADWADLPDRMHFILDLFRQEHENAALFQPPFAPGQVEAIAAGRVPDGRL